MNSICRSVSDVNDNTVFEKIEKKYGFVFENTFTDFFKNNNGGIPKKKIFECNGNEYEVRCFLSFNENEYNSIFTALDSFQKDTKGKIIPFAKDSADSYYCLNKDDIKVYFWDKGDDMYYVVANSFDDFISRLI